MTITLCSASYIRKLYSLVHIYHTILKFSFYFCSSAVRYFPKHVSKSNSTLTDQSLQIPLTLEYFTYLFLLDLYIISVSCFQVPPATLTFELALTKFGPVRIWVHQRRMEKLLSRLKLTSSFAVVVVDHRFVFNC
jgi:hypothetical protein